MRSDDGTLNGGTPPGAAGDLAVVVPLKSFDLAKGRLAAALSPAERARLARSMAAKVLAAAAPLPVWVVCDDTTVADWALTNQARVIWRTEPGLDQAAAAATAALAAEGVSRVIIAHGDLPRARRLGWVGEHEGVTIVTDRRGQGTNVLSIPTMVGFRFAYGPGSARAHRAEAARLGLDTRVVHDEELGWDVDVPEDLAVFDASIEP